MANVYGDKKAGQFAKREAHDRTRRMWDIVIVTCLAGGVIFGFIVAVLRPSRSIWALRLESISGAARGSGDTHGHRIFAART